MNFLVVSAELFGFPLYVETAPPWLKFGGIGYVIAHELFHTFASSSDYDRNNVMNYLESYWTGSSRENFDVSNLDMQLMPTRCSSRLRRVVADLRCRACVEVGISEIPNAVLRLFIFILLL